jgi:site-specific DNA-methyltransferase (adenine-specific)
METNIIHNLHCYEAEHQLDDNSVDCIVTSPPYWHLRDYGVEGQFGQEDNVEQYIENLLKLFDILYKKLKDTGTCFVNIGDTYNGSSYHRKEIKSKNAMNCNKRIIHKIKNRSLLNIPFRFATEMINRGWVLRNTIIWHKTNVIPQSSKNRFTVDFEPIFFFTKLSTNYYFEQQLEPFTYIPKYLRPNSVKYNYLLKYKGRRVRSVWKMKSGAYQSNHSATFPQELVKRMLISGCPENGVVLDPFIGVGTTAIVAKNLNMNYIGFELNSEYVKLANEKIKLVFE